MSRLLILLFGLSACTGSTHECSESSLIAVFFDEDRDGYGDSSKQQLVCEIGPQHATVGGDCDDTRATVFPGGLEECDGLDNNCNGAVDEELRVHTWYADEDGDGFGRSSRTAQACSAPPGFVDNDWDCYDNDPLSHPGADEFCDGKDNNCDGLVDDDDPNTVPESMPTWYKDNDVDGFGNAGEWTKRCTPPQNGAWVKNADDCDDANKAIHPDMPEICNEIDDDCDGHIDDSDADIDPAALTRFWYDGDGDGFGDDAISVMACDAPWFYVANGADCDDAEPNLQDSSSGWWVVDNDGDGYGDMNAAPQGPSCTPPAGGFVLQAYATDCNDTSSAVHPEAVEICDSVDNDCNGLTDDADDGLDLATALTFYFDADGDGFGNLNQPVKACVLPADASVNPDDCDDQDDAVHPDATEICNLGIDDDCDNLVDSADPSLDLSSVLTWYFDFDFDGWGDPTISIDACDAPLGYVLNDRDCDDNDASGPYMRPWIQDADGDGYGAGPLSPLACAPPGPDWLPGDLGEPIDCDDTDPTASPVGSEICGDGIDQDCNGEDEVCTLADTCAEAMAEAPYTTGFYQLNGNLVSYADNINMSSGDRCVSKNTPGQEGILPVKLAPGEILEASLTGSADMLMYLVTNCSAPSYANCEAGGDMAVGANSTEYLRYHNNTASTLTAYLVIDCPGNCGTFSMDFEIYPNQSYFMPRNCNEAQAEPPLTTGSYIIGGKLTANMVDNMNLAAYGASCTGYSTSGYDNFMPVQLDPGQVVYFWFTSRDGDAAIYALRDCFNGASCVAGDDSGDPEVIKYQNNTGAKEIVYLGFDTWNTVENRYFSRVLVE